MALERTSQSDSCSVSQPTASSPFSDKFRSRLLPESRLQAPEPSGTHWPKSLRAPFGLACV
ncbi:hypothetical protein PCASD_25462, partial [Puccinia coronata f. sp. avenae]